MIPDLLNGECVDDARNEHARYAFDDPLWGTSNVGGPNRFFRQVAGAHRIHYYARPGVEDLTAEDRLMSSLPYGLQPTHFNTMFFNICSPDDGQTWSTPWIIDDPAIYYLEGGSRQASRN